MNDTQHRDLFRAWRDAAERLTKWRRILASWQVGTRPENDGEFRAIKDHREITLLMRAELNALVGLMLEKNNITEMEWLERLIAEYALMERDLETKFPGFKAHQDGIDIDLAPAHETMKKLNFPP